MKWKYEDWNLLTVWRGWWQVSYSHQSAGPYFGQISDYPALLTSLWGWRAERGGADLNKSIITNFWWYNCFSCNQLIGSSFLLHKVSLWEKSIDLFFMKFQNEVYKNREDVLLLSLTNSYNTNYIEWMEFWRGTEVRLPHYYPNIFIGWHCYENKKKIISL